MIPRHRSSPQPTHESRRTRALRRPPWARLRRSDRRLAGDERGLVLIFWALSFIGLLMFLVIVADAGLVFLERRSLQNTADAAALAGARELWLDGPIAGEVEAVLFASESDGDLTNNTATASGITMRVTSTVGDDAASLLADPSLGFGSPAVSATATARIGASVLPGPGVFCIGTHFDVQSAARCKIRRMRPPWPGRASCTSMVRSRAKRRRCCSRARAMEI